MYELTVEARFSAAHFLRDYSGKCERLHGHNWLVRLTLAGEKLDGHGMLMDFSDARKLLSGAVAEFDHTNINDLAQFQTQNPTTENIARLISERVVPELPRGVRLARVTVWETPGSSACYSP